MQIYYLDYFIKLCEVKNITKTAQELNIVQQTLSNVIVSLENELGCRLLERSRGRNQQIVLTEKGREFYVTARRIRQNYLDFRNTDSIYRENVRTNLHIGMINQIYGRTILKILPVFREKYPNLPIDLINLDSNEYENALFISECDVVFSPLEVDEIYFDYQNVSDDQLALLITEEQMAALNLKKDEIEESIRRLDFAFLDRIPMIDYSYNNTYKNRWRLAQILNPGVVFSAFANSSNHLSALLKTGIGALCLPLDLIDEMYSDKKGINIFIIPPHPDYMRHVKLVYTKGRDKDPAVRDFIDLVINQ